MSTEDADEEAANKSSDYKEYSSSIAGGDAKQPISKEKVFHASSVYSSRKRMIDNSNERLVNNDQTTNIERSKDEELEDIKDADEIKSMKNTVLIASSTSKPDQQEPDDPRKGGKFCFERPRSMNESGISNEHKIKDISKNRSLDDTTHIPPGIPYPNMNAVSSIIRNLSKKGYDLVSRFTSRHYTEKEPGTASSLDSEDLKHKNWLRNCSDTKLKGVNIKEDYDTSKISTCKDVTKPLVNQRNNLIQD